MDDVQPYDDKPRSEYRGVSGGFRAGKRKRGNSLLKRKPREAVTVIRFDVHDSDGRIIALGATMATAKRESLMDDPATRRFLENE